MALVKLLLLCVLITAAVSLSGNWTEWRDATLCSAPPCECPGRVDEQCKTGRKVQVRNCVRDEGKITPCKYGKHGPIRMEECTASKKDCPGWSAWNNATACQCSPYKNEGTQNLVRLCDSPAPKYGDKGCFTGIFGEFAVKDKKVANNCKCDVIKTTTTTTTTTTAAPELPCCCDFYSDNDNDSEESEDGGTFGRRRRSIDDDYCDPDPTCSTCPQDDYYGGGY